MYDQALLDHSQCSSAGNAGGSGPRTAVRHADLRSCAATVGARARLVSAAIRATIATTPQALRGTMKS
jgi:hypothetical protein